MREPYRAPRDQSGSHGDTPKWRFQTPHIQTDGYISTAASSIYLCTTGTQPTPPLRRNIPLSVIYCSGTHVTAYVKIFLPFLTQINFLSIHKKYFYLPSFCHHKLNCTYQRDYCYIIHTLCINPNLGWINNKNENKSWYRFLQIYFFSCYFKEYNRDILSIFTRSSGKEWEDKEWNGCWGNRCRENYENRVKNCYILVSCMISSQWLAKVKQLSRVPLQRWARGRQSLLEEIPPRKIEYCGGKRIDRKTYSKGWFGYVNK